MTIQPSSGSKDDNRRPPGFSRATCSGTQLCAILLTGLLWPLAAQGHRQPDRPELPNFDKRAEAAAAAGQQAADSGKVIRQQAAQQLKARLPAAQVDEDELLGTPKFVRALDGFLTGPGGEGRAVKAETARALAPKDPHRAAKAFLNEHATLFGHGAQVLAAARVKRDYVTAHNGLRTVVWQQELDGIGVFDGVLMAHTTQRGELVNMSSRFLAEPGKAADKGLANRKSLQQTPKVSVQKAVAAAAQNVGEAVTEQEVATTGPMAQDAEKRQRLAAAALLGETEAKLVWLPMNRDTMRLCWEVILTSRTRSEMFQIVVDAETGEVLLRRCLTHYISDASYRVFTSDSPSPFSPGHSTPSSSQPPVVSRQMVTLSALSATASPNGWINDGNNTTLGNNVDAHLDRDANDVADPGSRPTGSPFRVFDFPMDLAQAPVTYTNACVVQLFYWNNFAHDKLYDLGFTEAAGNFQTDNFGRGGLGNDAVQADGQDGSGTDNANFSTPPDGSAPRMQMYIFTGPTPDRDGDFDAEIILHEYVHGLSNRLVGGGVGMSALQSDGMGEGWSDFYALALLSESSDDANACYAAGGYATYQLGGLTENYYYGIRRYPYSTDMTKNPLTFKDIDPAQASSHTGIPRSPIIGNTANEVHNMGEVWCVTLWEARARLIAKYGWATGNQRILQLVTDGMKLSPANPNYLQARDAILQADQVLTGGANQSELWAAFAKRGMGFSATSPSSSTTTGVVEAYDLPDDLRISPSGPVASSGTIGGPFTPSQITYTLTNVSASALAWTAIKTQSWTSLSATNGVLAAGAYTTVTWSLNSGANALAAGSYGDTLRFSNSVTGVTQSRALSLTVSPPTIVFFNLDTDPGWTRQGEWAFGTPTGGGGTSHGYHDPTSGATGVNVFGINLSGDYSTAVGGPYYLTTGPINLTGYTGTQLRFKRWLNTDYPTYVYATIDVSNDGTNWSNLFTNPSGTEIAENAWTTQTYTLGSMMDNKPTVYIRWGHRVASSSDVWAYSGWNIDDVELLGTSMGPLPPTIGTSSPLPWGTIGVPYSQTLTASGGATPYTWSLDAGSLPSGLSLSSGGVISGTPDTAGVASFTVRVTGDDGLFSTKDFSLTITPPSPPGTNIIDGVALNYAGIYIVGTNESFQGLIITNAGSLTSGGGAIGNSVQASSNYALVTGAGSLWTNSGNLTVGVTGSFNRLTINNTGRVVNSVGYVGFDAAARNNSVLVSDAGTMWSNSSYLYVGYAGSSNTLTITNGARVFAKDSYIGSSSGSNNSALVSGTGSLWNVYGGGMLGDAGAGNTLTINNGGSSVIWNLTIGNAGTKNGVVVSGTGSAWKVDSSHNGNLTVGNSGSGNFVTISNGGQVTSGWTAIGRNGGATNNTVVVTDPGSLWTIDSGGFEDKGLHVGYYGARNSLLIANGGRVISPTNFVIGSVNASSFGNSVLVTGAGSVWSNAAVTFIGRIGPGNSLTLTNAGQAFDVIGCIGSASIANNNTVLVAGAGSMWSNRNFLYVGASSPQNSLTIADGGRVVSSNAYIGCNAGSSYNTVLVTDAGSVWNNSNLFIGATGSFNQLTITNGGSVVGVNGCVGLATGAIGNTAWITGADSVWSNAAVLAIGGGSGNVLRLADNGQVYAGVLSNLSSGLFNMSGGGGHFARVVNAGTVRQTGGLFDSAFFDNTGLLQLTNGANIATVFFNEAGGTLLHTGGEQRAGYATNFGVWTIATGAVANVTNFFNQTGAQLIGSGGTLNGSVTDAGTLSFGSSPGAFTVSGNMTLLPGATMLMDLNGTGAGLLDHLALSGLFTAGGTLTVSVQDGYTPQNGDVFDLLDYGSVAGSFGQINVPGNPGWTWDLSHLLAAPADPLSGSIVFNLVTSTINIVDGVVTNAAGVYTLGNDSAWNWLIVTNGGVLLSDAGVIGNSAAGSNNYAVVTGAGSLWSNSGDLIVGATGAFNRLTVTNNGTATATNIVMGYDPNSTGNMIVIAGGSLLATNAAAGGALDVRRGTLTLNSGTVTVDRFYATNGAGSVVNFNGGTFNSGGSTASYGSPFRVGNGSSAATLHLNGGTHSFANSLFINTNASLAGTGVITGVITNAGAIAPGDSAGIITGSSNLTLLGSSLLQMQLAGTNDWLFDQINIAGTLTFGGTLTLSLLDGFSPVAGNRFDLFDFSSGIGVFSTANLPTLSAGLMWDTSLLYSTGEIEADTVPPFFDDFEPGIDMAQWSAFGGSVGSTVLATNYGGSVSGANSLWFGDAGSRYAASRSLDTTQGGVADFWLRIASGSSSTWETADLPGEGIVLEYSVNSGSTWVECGRYDTTNYTVWTHITVDIPVAAKTANTQFRWKQLSNSGTGYDHWALDDVGVLIGPQPPTITTSSPLPTGVTGSFYSQTLAAIGGTTPYAWSLASGSLPSGLSLSSAGVISGTPDTATTANFTVQVTGNDGLFSMKSFSLTIYATGGPLADALDQPGLVVTTSGNQPWFLQTATTHDGVDAAQSGAITHSQQSVMETTITGPGDFSFWWKVSSESGFDYLTFYIDGVAQSGAISGTVDWQQKTYSVTAGSHVFKWIYSKDGSVSSGSDCGWVDQLALPAPWPVITTSSPLPSGTTGVAYSQALAATGGTTPYTWSLAAGSLPSGLSLSSAGVISGTPDTVTTANFTVQVTGNDGQFSTKAFSLTIAAPSPPTITTSSPLPSCAVGAAYSQTLTATGGTTPYTWSLAAGSLPSGLSLSSAGVISGTPDTVTTANFTVQVTGGNGLSSTKDFVLVVYPAPVSPLTNVVDGFTLTYAGTYFVGSNGSFYALIVTNGGVLTSSGGTIGNSSASRSNNVWVTGAGSLWSNSGSLYVGNSGAVNRLTIADSGTVSATDLVVGVQSTSTGNVLTVTSGNLSVTNGTGTGAMDVRRGTLNFNGGNIVTDKLYVTNNTASAGSNALFNFRAGTLTTRNGSRIVAPRGSNFVIGATPGQTATWNILGGTNTLTNIVISSTPPQTILGGVTGAVGIVNVTGAGTVWSNSDTLCVGNASTGNQMTVTNGARVANGSAYIGYSASASNNTVFVSDAGSVWSNRNYYYYLGFPYPGTLYVGYYGSSNSLTITNGGTVWAGAYGVVIGAMTGSVDNSITVNGGFLTVNSSLAPYGYLSSGGYLYVRRGSFTLNSGTVSVSSLYATNSVSSIIAFNGGTLSSGGTVISNGNVFLVGGVAGTGAIFNLGGGRHSFNNGLIIGNTGASNQLNVLSGASLTASNLIIGALDGAANNSLLVSTGTVQITDGLGGGILDVRRGSLTIHSGTVKVDQLWATNGVASVLNLNGGHLNTAGSVVSNDMLFTVGDGTRTAALNLLSGSHSFANGLAVQTNGTLAGGGALFGGGVTLTNRGTIAVGMLKQAPQGLTNAGDLALAAGSILSFGISGKQQGSDYGFLRVQGSGMLDGRLDVALSSFYVDAGGLLDATDLFTVLTADAPLSGGFTNVASGARLSSVEQLGSFAVNYADSNLVLTGFQTDPELGLLVVTNHYVTNGLVAGNLAPNNQLIVTNGGVLDSTLGLLGRTAGSSNNTALVTGTGSIWNDAALLRVGNFGSNNQLMLAASGQIFSTEAAVGWATSACNNAVVVTDTNSIWRVTNSFSVGYGGAFNQLTITNGGRVLGASGYVGYAVGACNNSVLIAGIGSVWSNYNNLYVGYSGSVNQLVITNGGQVWNQYGYSYVGYDAGASNNSVSVSDVGSLWSNYYNLYVGYSGSVNQLVITNGGQVWNQLGSGYIGYNASASGNTVLVSGAGSLWSNYNNVCVGYSGSGNQLVITNGGQVRDQYGFGYVGYGASASNNTGLVSGIGSLWTSGYNLDIGYSGSGNQLIITKGGQVWNQYCHVGYSSGASNNSVLIADSGSLLSNYYYVYVGYSGSGNQLVITNGGQAWDQYGFLGCNASASNNSVTVTDAGSVWNHTNDVYVGYYGVSNRLAVANGGVVYGGMGYLGYYNAASNNSVSVADPGSLWSNSGLIAIGKAGSNNSLTVANGGRVVDDLGVIGLNASANSNAALITGAGSLWSNSSSLFVGSTGAFSWLTVSNGGMVTATNVVIGADSSSTGNVVTISGGSLLAANAVAGGALDVRRGALTLNSGTVAVDRLYVTNSMSSLFSFNGGTLSSRGSAINNGAVFRVGDGLSSATLHMAGGNHSFSSGLFINPNAWLTGTGAVTGVITNAGGIAPGDSAGILTGSSNLTLLANSLLLMELAGTNDWLYDQVNIAGTLRVGGTLTVSLLDGYTPQDGDVFDLFDFGAVAGAFDHFNLPGGLEWSWDLSHLLAAPTDPLSGSVVFGLIAVGGWTNIIDGVVTNAAGGYMVGDATSRNGLVITNGGVLIDTSGIIGNQSTAKFNTVIVTGLGSVWSNEGVLCVGNAGADNTLVITNGGTVLAGDAYVGASGTARNNQVTVAGGGSVWSNARVLTVGSGGLGNTVILNDGGRIVAGVLSNASGSIFGIMGGNAVFARVVNAGTINQGGGLFDPDFFDNTGLLQVTNGTNIATVFLNEASGTVQQSDGEHDVNYATNFGTWTISSGVANLTNFVNEDHGTLTVSGGTLNGSLTIGNTGSFSQLTIINAGVAIGSSSYLGYYMSAASNSILVTGVGSLWSNSGSLSVGMAGRQNNLTVAGSGVVFNALGSVGWSQGADSNHVLVAGAGTLWNNSDSLIVGGAGNANTLVISNGGRVAVAGNAFIGFTNNWLGNFGGGSNNSAFVTGAGSLWSNSGSLFVGNLSGGNKLTIANEGHVIAANLTLGVKPTSTGNVLTIANGNLAVQGGALDIRRGMLTLDGGMVTVNQFVATNFADSVVNFNGGMLNSGSSTVTNSSVFQVGNGTSTATLHLLGGPHSFADGLFVNTNASLTGTGVITGVITNAGTIAPGDSVGTITGSSDLTLLSNSLLSMELAGTNLNLLDRLVLGGLFTADGTLTVALQPGYTPENGDVFDLFDYASVAGSFYQINLPAQRTWRWDLSHLVTTPSDPLSGSILFNQLSGSGWTNIIDGVVTNAAGTYMLGDDTGWNWLIITNAGVLIDTSGVIGNQSKADFNTAVVTGSGSLWSNENALYVGYAGSSAELSITNGGAVLDRDGYVGYQAGSSNNWVIVAGRDSTWGNAGVLTIGGGTSGNGVSLGAGGRIYAGALSNVNGSIFSMSGGSTFFGRVYSGGTISQCGGVFDPELFDNKGLLQVTNGTNIATVFLNETSGIVEQSGGEQDVSYTTNFGIWIITTGAVANLTNFVNDGNGILTVAGGTLNGSLTIGNTGSFSQLTITNGGVVAGTAGVLGYAATSSHNTAIISDAGSLWSNGGDLSVGFAGSFNSLTITSGAQVVDNNGCLGTNAGANSNVVLVTDAGSLWRNTNDLIVGFSGVGNQLIVTNEARVINNTGYIGYITNANNNEVLVTGVNSAWLLSGDLIIGSGGDQNRLTISGGATVSNYTGRIGYGIFSVPAIPSTNNNVTVTGVGSVWFNSGELSVGGIGNGNSLVISDGGKVINGFGSLGANSSTSTGNVVIVTDPGSVWSNRSRLYLGMNGGPNQILVTNGGQLFSAGGTISSSSFSSSNLMQVVGTNSTWLNTGDLIVGKGGQGNMLVIGSGGQVFDQSAAVGDALYGRDNSVIVTGVGSLWSNSGVLTVGGGVRNSLTLSAGGQVVNGIGYIGLDSSSSSNLVLVTGANSLWSNVTDLYVGNSGSFNRLTISNNATVTAGSTISIGNVSSASSNILTVTDAGTLLRGAGEIWVGNSGVSNTMNILSGATVTNSGWFQVGRSGGGRYNMLLVSGAGSLLSNAANGILIGNGGLGNLAILSNGACAVTPMLALGWGAASVSNTVIIAGTGTRLQATGSGITVGTNGAFNTLVIANAATVTNLARIVVGGSASATGNFLLVTDPGTYLTNSGEVRVGDYGPRNTMVISNGASVASAGNSYIGTVGGANSNSVLVTGLGSFWKNSGTLTVGNAGVSNSLTISGSGTLLSSNVLVGIASSSTGSLLTVSGGFLYATNAAQDGTLDIRRGTFALNSGTVTVDRFYATNGTSSSSVFNGGALNSGGSTVTNGSVFQVGNGVSAATLHLNGGTHSFANNLFINTNASLTGTGAITGVITNAGTIAPGDSAGILTGSGNLILLANSQLQMELAGTNNWLYDQINLAGTLTFGGALTVSLLNGFTPGLGDRFDLFDFTSSSGFFTSTNLPSLPAGLVWDASLLYTTGELDAELAPVLSVAVSRKVHGGAGTFDLNLNLDPSANPTVEPRQRGPDQVVFTFNKDMKAADGTLDVSEFVLTNATFVSASIVNSNLTLNLTNVVDQSKVTVVMNGLTDLSGNALVGTNAVRIRALYGDANLSGTVSAPDVQYVKNRLLQAANAGNYLADLNLSGTISAPDVQQVKNNLLHSAPLGGGLLGGGVTQTFLSAQSSGGTDKSVCPTTLGEALSASELQWSVNGDDVWAPTLAPDGSAAAWSGSIGDLQVSWIETTVTGPGTITFQWKVSSELNADFLTFSIDGADQAGRISGEVDWQPMTFTIPSGTHLLRWTYAKNREKAFGLDAAWLRRVTYQPFAP